MPLETIWFCIVAVMIAMYVVFDGFDLGVGAIYGAVARTEEDRRIVLQSIGPVWDGNEVWLLAAGGTLYFAFPRLYASAFSGFYLPLMIVLWLLMLRAVSLEFRAQVDSPLWRRAWDVTFAGSSTMLAIFYGAALGNVVRGVPLDDNGEFFSPLWTDLTLGAERGIIDWFTVIVGVAALAALVLHGALWTVLRTSGALRDRARGLARGGWWAVVATTGAVTVASFAVQPQIRANLGARPWGLVFPALAVAGLAGIRWRLAAEDDHGGFLASCAYLVGMLTSAVFGVYPYVLPAGPDAGRSLTLWDAAAPAYGLRVGLLWFIPGMILVAAYFVFTYRSFAGKITAEELEHGHY